MGDRNAERVVLPHGSTLTYLGTVAPTSHGWIDQPTWHYLDADDFIKERTMSKTDRHDELVALLTDIRDRLPRPKREEAFVEMYPAAVGHNLRHWKPGPHTAGVGCSCGPEKVSHVRLIERAPREDEDPDEALVPYITIEMLPAWADGDGSEWRREAKILRDQRPDAAAAAALCDAMAEAMERVR